MISIRDGSLEQVHLRKSVPSRCYDVLFHGTLQHEKSMVRKTDRLCSQLSRSAQGPQTDLAAARAIFERLSSKRPARQSSLPLLLSFDDVVADGDLSPSRAYAERLDLSPEKGHVFIDGMYIQTEGSWQKFVQATLSLHSRYLQAQVSARDSSCTAALASVDTPSLNR